MTGHRDGSDAASAARRERRRWVNEHHPDRGGDPAAFAAGLAARGSSAVPPRVDRPAVRRTRPVRRRLRAVRRHLRSLISGRRHRRRRVL